MSTTRELKLKLTIDAPDPSKPSKAFQDIAAQANKLSEAAKDAQRHVQRFGTAPGMGPASPLGMGPASPLAITAPGGARYTPGGTGWQVSGAAPIAAQSHGATYSALLESLNRTQRTNSQLVQEVERRTTRDRALQPMAMHQAAIQLQHQRPPAPLAPQHLPTPVATPAAAASAAQSAGGAFGVAGKIGGIAVAAAGFADTAAKLVDALGQSESQFLTAREKTLNVVRAVPLIGDAIGGMADRVLRSLERLRNPEAMAALDERRHQVPREIFYGHAQASAEAQRQRLKREVGEAGDAVKAIKDNPLPSSMLGLLPYGIGSAVDKRLVEAADARAISGRDVDRARMAADRSYDDVARNRSSYSEALRDAEKRKKAFDQADLYAREPWRNPSKHPLDQIGTVQLEKSRLDYQAAIARTQSELLKLEESITANKGKQLSLVQAEAEFRKRQTGESLAQLEILKEQQARGKAMAAQFGSLDSVQQRGLLDVAERFKKGGRDFVTSEEYQQLQQFAPDQVRQEAEKAAGSTGSPGRPGSPASTLYQQFQKQFGTENAALIDKQIADIEAKVKVKMEIDPIVTAEAMKKALEVVNIRDMLGTLVTGKLRIEMEEFRLKQSAGQSAPSN